MWTFFNQSVVKITEELDKLGINEFTLFGSLDYLGKYLSRIP